MCRWVSWAYMGRSVWDRPPMSRSLRCELSALTQELEGEGCKARERDLLTALAPLSAATRSAVRPPDRLVGHPAVR